MTGTSNQPRRLAAACRCLLHCLLLLQVSLQENSGRARHAFSANGSSPELCISNFELPFCTRQLASQGLVVLLQAAALPLILVRCALCHGQLASACIILLGPSCSEIDICYKGAMRAISRECEVIC